MKILVLRRPKITFIISFVILAISLTYVLWLGVVPSLEPILTNFIDQTQEKVVVLTFDDGPDPAYTGPILDILKKKQVGATFFVLGECVEANPDLLRRMLKEGHEIGNHGYTHDYSQRYSQSKTLDEIRRTDKAVYAATGIHTYFYRPPGGFTLKSQTEIINRNGYEVILWSADSRDWRKPGVNRIKKNVLSNVFPGAIVLFHDGGGMRSQTVKALEQVIDQLRVNGYRFVTLRELFHLDSKPRT